MKFGETIEAYKKIHPEWSDYYLDYVHLVHILEEYQKEQDIVANSHITNNSHHDDNMSYASNASTTTTTTATTILQNPMHQHWITTELLVQIHIQLEKITLFILHQQGNIAHQMHTIRNELRCHPSTTSTTTIFDPNGRTMSTTSPSILLSSSTSVEFQPPPYSLVMHNGNIAEQHLNEQIQHQQQQQQNLEMLVQQYEERYYHIGVQLLRLYQFIDVNVTGIRKLLKKHDKIVYSSSHGGRRSKKRNKLSLSLLLNASGNTTAPSNTNHTNMSSLNHTTSSGNSRSNNNNTSSSINNIHSVIPWSPRAGGSIHPYHGTTTSNAVGIYTRRKLSAEAFGNALLQPLLHDEGLTAITATLEVGVQELYALLVVPSNHSQQNHTRNSSDASLDFLWDTTPPSSTPSPITTHYGSTSLYTTNDVTVGNGASDDALTPLVSPPVPPGSMKYTRGIPSQQQQQQQQLPPKQPPSRSVGVAQSARVQSRKTFHHHRPSLSGSLRSLSTSNVLGNSNSSTNPQYATNTIPGLSSMDSLLIQIQVARRKLQQTNGYIQLLAAPMMMNDMDMVDDGDQDDKAALLKTSTTNIDEDGGLENMAFIVEEDDIQLEQSRINISNVLNLGSSMLYMCNYYIVAPTSASYAERLGGKAALASMIIGMTPVAALVSTILFSWWTNHSYKYALIFASACSVLGNLLYSFGLPFDSIEFVMVGRLLTGFGSARSINRRYICDTFPRSERTAASAAFVTASAMGMAAGPAIASILHYITTEPNGNERVETLYWQSENAPGWFMVFLWSVFLICLIVYFEDPPKKKYETALKKAKSIVELSDSTTEQKPLLSNNTSVTDTEHAISSSYQTNSTVKEPPIWRNIPVMITFLIYFVLKLVLEAVLSSSAVLTEYYFDWDSGRVGWYLAIMGLLVLPANAVVASLAQSYDDRELITGIQIVLFIGCLSMLQFREIYHLSQYIIGTVLLVVSANALEGPNMSLLSQTIPKSWSTGIFNVGLLSTEAGTFGRAMGNVLLTLFGNDGLEHLLNRAFGTYSVLSFISLYITYYYYDHLEPWDADD
jgi:hypothetical protein